MRNLIGRYRSSKFRCFLSGLVFAILSLGAMFLCVTLLTDKTATRLEILLSFGLSVLSMSLGFISMLRATPKSGYKMRDIA